MTRLANALSIIKNALHTRVMTPIVTLNKHTEITLILLRQIGLIQGFTILPPKNLKSRAARAKVVLKYMHPNNPILKDLHLFKNTKSNFFVAKPRINPNVIYLVSNFQGMHLSTRPVSGGRLVAYFVV